MEINNDTVVAYISGVNACRHTILMNIKAIVENLALNKAKHPDIMVFSSSEALRCCAEMIAEMDIPDVEKVDDFFVESIRSMRHE